MLGYLTVLLVYLVTLNFGQFNFSIQGIAIRYAVHSVTGQNLKFCTRSILACEQAHTLEHKPARCSCEREIDRPSRETPLHQNPSRRIALLFAARACDSNVSRACWIGVGFRSSRIQNSGETADRERLDAGSKKK